MIIFITGKSVTISQRTSLKTTVLNVSKWHSAWHKTKKNQHWETASHGNVNQLYKLFSISLMDELFISAWHTTTSVLKVLRMCVRVSVWLCLFVFLRRSCYTAGSSKWQLACGKWGRTQVMSHAGVSWVNTFDYHRVGLRISVIEHCVKYLSFYLKINNFTQKLLMEAVKCRRMINKHLIYR